MRVSLGGMIEGESHEGRRRPASVLLPRDRSADCRKECRASEQKRGSKREHGRGDLGVSLKWSGEFTAYMHWSRSTEHERDTFRDTSMPPTTRVSPHSIASHPPPLRGRHTPTHPPFVPTAPPGSLPALKTGNESITVEGVAKVIGCVIAVWSSKNKVPHHFTPPRPNLPNPPAPNSAPSPRGSSARIHDTTHPLARPPRS